MKTCLIVEPSQLVRKVAAHILRSENFVVAEASSGAESLCHAKVDAPALVLVDSGVLDIAPFELIRQFRSLHHITSRIVLTTTVNDPWIRSQVLLNGGDEVLLKPYDRFAIRELLQATEPGVVAA